MVEKVTGIRKSSRTNIVLLWACCLGMAFAIDRQVMLIVRQLPESMKAIFSSISDVTEPSHILAAIALGILVPLLLPGQFRSLKIAKVFASCLVAVLSALALVMLMKFVVGRARPLAAANLDSLLFYPFSHTRAFNSFPSAQAAIVSVACCFGVLKSGKWHGTAFAIISLVALARVVLEVHWLSDVIAGTGIGGLVATTFVAVTARFSVTAETRPSHNISNRDGQRG